MKKLKLNKETVSLLNNDKMKQINGGGELVPTGYAPCLHNPTQACYSING